MRWIIGCGWHLSHLFYLVHMNVYAEQLTGAGLGFLWYRYLSAMYFNNILKYDCFVNQWRLLPEYILWVKVRSMLWQLAWQWVVDVNNQLGFLIPLFSAQGVAWIFPRLSPSMQWYWYYLVERRNMLVQDLARFVSMKCARVLLLFDSAEPEQ